MEQKYLVYGGIFLIALIVLGGIIMYFGTPGGEYVGKYYIPIVSEMESGLQEADSDRTLKNTEIIGLCDDSDGGQDYYSKGVTIDSLEIYIFHDEGGIIDRDWTEKAYSSTDQKEDACFKDDPDVVVEYYCGVSEITEGDYSWTYPDTKVAGHRCPGGCINGECIKIDEIDCAEEFGAGYACGTLDTWRDTCGGALTGNAIRLDRVEDLPDVCNRPAPLLPLVGTNYCFTCEEPSEEALGEECVFDSDVEHPYWDGKNIFKWGYLETYDIRTERIFKYVKGDICSTPNSVRELFCEQDGSVSHYYETCPQGYTCNNGECVSESCEAFSSAGEKVDGNGNDKFKFGIIRKGDRKEEDICHNERTLQEWYCDNNLNAIRSMDINCQNGCFGGVCLEVGDRCTETDGGKSSLRGGSVTLGALTRDDHCLGDVLIEWYCWHEAGVETIKQAIIDCSEIPNADYTCIDNACVRVRTTDIEVACNDPDNDLGVQKWTVRSTTTKGDESSIDSCDGNTLIEYGCMAGNIFSTRMNCITLGYDMCHRGACVNTECVDSDGDLGFDELITQGTTTLTGAPVQTDSCVDHNRDTVTETLIEWKCRVDGTRYSFEQNCQDMEGYVKCDNGACVADAARALDLCGDTPACSDSDADLPGGFFEALETKGTTTKGVCEEIDTCDGNTLTDWYCDGDGKLKSEEYDCTTTYNPHQNNIYVGCEGGACYPKTNWEG